MVQRDALIPGTLNALILKALTQGSLHGYAISKWIRSSGADVLRVEEGVLYPALHRLEEQRLIKASWGRNDTGRRAKFYSLTPAGKRHLDAEIARWTRMSRAVSLILDVQGER
jgi:PadR family transcriptional regulator